MATSKANRGITQAHLVADKFGIGNVDKITYTYGGGSGGQLPLSISYFIYNKKTSTYELVRTLSYTYDANDRITEIVVTA